MIDIYKRGDDASEVKLGTVQFDDKVRFVGFEGDDARMVAWLKRGITVDGEVVKPEDGQAFMDGLPIYLRGDYLWARPE